MKIGVLGGGYGLYGYAVAAHHNRMEIVLKEKYRKTISSRSDLHWMLNEITFVENDADVINLSETLVFALPPKIQADYLRNKDLRGKRIFLEKPLAPTLNERAFLLEHLKDQGIQFSLGYLFMLTEWGKQLTLDNSAGEVRDLRIEWDIPRPKSNWKMSLESGGGIINYYVIHFLKLVVDLNYDALEVKCVIEENYCRLFSDTYDLRVTLTEDSIQNFDVSWLTDREERAFQFATPFGPQNIQGFKDIRVKYLSEYLLLKPKPELEYDTETRVSKLLFQILT